MKQLVSGRTLSHGVKEPSHKLAYREVSDARVRELKYWMCPSKMRKLAIAIKIYLMENDTFDYSFHWFVLQNS